MMTDGSADVVRAVITTLTAQGGGEAQAIADWLDTLLLNADETDGTLEDMLYSLDDLIGWARLARRQLAAAGGLVV
ncbi:hypothetical protein [Sulfobacillus sp. hq2]|uniref:hypothetical protein n=1 Tax=Sulfobacillus sp. hq2 TaxID=2039167 RepID=UPI0011AEF8AC|nr:hypothetical protein [Sulfobacillus sp. hq2]